MKKDVIIIGGGASGIACALRIKMNNPALKVLILEQNPRIGKKILKTGNGKCNISNLNMGPEHYNNQEFLENSMRSFSVDELIEFFNKLGLILRTDSSNRLYPYSESANTVLEVLLYALDKLGVEVKCNQEVLEVSISREFKVISATDSFTAGYLVMATGSIAQEKTNGYNLLKALNHSQTNLEPGLVPLKTKEKLNSIRGIRVKCKASVFEKEELLHEEEGEILFKEEGLSGVLALNLSRYARFGGIVSLDLFPDRKILPYLEKIIKFKDQEDALLGMLPKMLVYEVLKRNKGRNLAKISETLHNLTFEVIGNYGFGMAQITLGGIRTEEVNYDFSSKLVKNLSIIGEVLDIDGECGGYNLHFAWMSGILAAETIIGVFEKNL
ncbi:MAG: aminoacetone oxidase family FAD-binding enzyme [Bacilli bacterium]|nr:aminoacetone oxidase family FAD-binding enzyme [Bacilli bacterium]